MIEQQVSLLGVMPKKGSGKFDTGKEWKTDHVELHVLMPLDTNKGGHGYGGQMVKLQDHDKWLPTVSGLVGKEVVLQSQIVTDGKGGGQSIQVMGVRPVSQQTKATA